MRFGIIGGSYTSRSKAVAAQRVVNLFPQTDESGNGQAKASFYWSPGLAAFSNIVGASSINGACWTGQRMFCVSQGFLYEIAADGTDALQVPVRTDNNPIQFAIGPKQLVFCSAGNAYCFDLRTNRITDLTPQMDGSPVGAVFCDGYFLIWFANSQQFQISALEDGTTWPGANVDTVSVFPDNIVSMKENHRQVTVLGSLHGAVYYDSGSDNIFDLVPNSKMEHGNAAAFSHARLDNTDFWIAQDENGNAYAVKLSGDYTPQRISTYAVEHIWQDYFRIDDAESYVFQIDGHTFWHVYFPSAFTNNPGNPQGASWRFDVGEGLWHEVGYWNTAKGRYDAHHSRCHVFAFGKHLVGDWQSGNIYEMAMKYYDDAGNAKRWVVRSPTVGNELQWDSSSMLTLDFDTGQGPIPPFTGPITGAQNYVLEEDQNGDQWLLTIDNTGKIGLTPTANQIVAPLFLNDQQSLNQTWQVGIQTAAGVPYLTLNAVAFNSLQPNSLALTTQDGTLETGIFISNGVLNVLAPLPAYRGPQVMIRFSKDRTRTWTNELMRDCGQGGEYTKRVVVYRLGKYRNLTCEISGSDPVPWVLVDAYLGPPVERLTSKLRAQA